MKHGYRTNEQFCELQLVALLALPSAGVIGHTSASRSVSFVFYPWILAERSQVDVMKFPLRFSLRTFLIAVTMLWPAYFLSWRITHERGIPDLKYQLIADFTEQLHTKAGYDGDPDRYQQFTAPAPFLVYGERSDLSFTTDFVRRPNNASTLQLERSCERQWFVWCFAYSAELPFRSAWREEASMKDLKERIIRTPIRLQVPQQSPVKARYTTP